MAGWIILPVFLSPAVVRTSGQLPLLHKGLEWAYILLCFALVWYGIVLISELWRWVMTRRGGSDLVRTSTKLMLALLLAWSVIQVGVLTATT